MNKLLEWFYSLFRAWNSMHIAHTIQEWSFTFHLICNDDGSDWKSARSVEKKTKNLIWLRVHNIAAVVASSLLGRFKPRIIKNQRGEEVRWNERGRSKWGEQNII